MFLAEKGHVLEEKNETTDFWLLNQFSSFLLNLNLSFMIVKSLHADPNLCKVSWIRIQMEPMRIQKPNPSYKKCGSACIPGARTAIFPMFVKCV